MMMANDGKALKFTRVSKWKSVSTRCPPTRRL